jgi:hypothetical protein
MEVPFAGQFAAMQCTYSAVRSWNVQSPQNETDHYPDFIVLLWIS